MAGEVKRRRHKGRAGIRNPAGTKRIKRFIRDATGDAPAYRDLLRRRAPNDPMNFQE
jgi:hypothetical protein